MTKEEKQKLKGMLPPKWRSTVAERTGFSVCYIDKIMAGAAHLEIEGAILLLAQEHQEKIKNLERLKNELL